MLKAYENFSTDEELERKLFARIKAASFGEFSPGISTVELATIFQIDSVERLLAKLTKLRKENRIRFVLGKWLEKVPQREDRTHETKPRVTYKEEAIAAGKKTYFTGKKCKRGHIAARDVHNDSCIECKIMTGKRQNERRRREREEARRQRSEQHG